MKPLRFAICVLVAALASTSAAHAQNGPISGSTFAPNGRPSGGVNIAICQSFTTTAASVTNNVATLTFSTNPITAGFVSGATLTVFGFSGADTYFDGTFTVASTSATTISFSLAHANASATTSGSVYQIGTSTQACAPLATIFTDQTGLFTSPNPFTSDGLGNYVVWAAPGYYATQFYGPKTTTTFSYTGVACFPGSVTGCAGSGTIAGTAALNQVAVGSAPNTLTSFTGFTFIAGNLQIPATGTYQIGSAFLLASGTGLTANLQIGGGTNWVSTASSGPNLSIGNGAGLGWGSVPSTGNLAIGNSAGTIGGTASDTLVGQNTATGLSGNSDEVFGNSNCGSCAGSDEIIIGDAVFGLNSAVGSSNNVFIGHSVMEGSSTAGSVTVSDNIAIGNLAGTGTGASPVGTSGIFNILIGEETNSPSAISTGSHNIILGNGMTAATPTASNQMDLGDVLLCTGINGPSSSNCTAEGNFKVNGTLSLAAASGILDMHAGLHTTPSLVGTTAAKPATCTVGEEYFANDATAGQNIFECGTTNTWTQQLNSGAAGMSTSGSNAAATAVGASWIPGAANTDALGSAPLPWTQLFLGVAANKSLSVANLAALTANRTVFTPDANSMMVQDCPASANKVVTAIPIGTALCTQAFINASAASVPSYLADSGSSTVYVVTLSPAITAYAAGLTVRFLPANANSSTTPTLNVNGVGAATITKFGAAALSLNDLVTTATAEVVYSAAGNWELQNPNTFSSVMTSASVNTLTNKTYNAESTGNALSEPVRAFQISAGCANGSTAGPAFVTGSSNAPTAQCAGSTVPKGVLKFATGNVAYISSFQLPPDWNAGASTDLQLCFTTTDTTNGHITSFNIQTAFNKVDGTATDDPALNALQALSVTTGASQVAGGELCGTLTGLTMTGSGAGYNFEIAITRNNSGTDTNTDTGVAVKYASIVLGVTKNAANR